MSAEGAAPTTNEERQDRPSPFLSGRRTRTQEKGPVVTDRLEQTRAPAAAPFRLNLEQQRNRARDLQRGLIRGDADALLRFRWHHPNPQAISDPDAHAIVHKLSEAQLIIARELGVPSWPKLKAHILAMQQSRDRIENGAPAPDRDARTLHIRCGADIKSTLT